MANQLIAIAIPIVKEKYTEWENFIQKLHSEYKKDFTNKRRQYNVHERTFLQKTPNGDMVIVTLEGPDPMGAFQNFFKGNDEFTNWFVQQVKEVHGVDLRQPLPGPAPELVTDSENM